MSNTTGGFGNMKKSWCHENGYWRSSPITMTYRKPVIGVSTARCRYYNDATLSPDYGTKCASTVAHVMLANWQKSTDIALAAH